MDFIISSIFNVILAALIDIVANIFGWFNKMINEMFGADTNFFDSLFAFNTTDGARNREIWNNTFIAIALGMCICMVLIALFKNLFSGFGIKGDSPFKLIFRIFFGIGFVYLLKPIMLVIFTGSDTSGSGGHVGIFEAMYNAVANMDMAQGLLNDSNSVGTGLASFAVNAGSTLAGSWLQLLYLFVLVAILINYVKLLLEMIERYLMVNLLIFFAPLAAPTFISEDTSRIFFTYIKMFFGQCTILLLNAVSLNLITYGLVGISGIMVGNTITGFFALMGLLAFTKIAQRMDNYLRDLGVTVGITGGNLLGEAIIGGKVVRSILGGGGSGNGGGGGGGGGGPKGPPDGPPNDPPGSVVGGVFGGALSKVAGRFRNVMNAGATARKAIDDRKDGETILHSYQRAEQKEHMLNRPTTYSRREARKMFGSAQTDDGKQFVNFSDGNFAMQLENGDWIARTKEPQEGIYSHEIQDAKGNTWYETNMTKENAAYAAQHKGRDMPSYQAFMGAIKTPVGSSFDGQNVNTMGETVQRGTTGSAKVLALRRSNGKVTDSNGMLIPAGEYYMKTSYNGVVQTQAVSKKFAKENQDATMVPITVDSVKYADNGEIGAMSYSVNESIPPQPDSPQPDSPQPDSPQPDSPQPEPVIPEPAIPEPAIPEPAIPEPAIPEPAIPEPVILGSSGTNPAMPEPSGTNPAMPEPSGPNPAMPEPSGTNPAMPEPSGPNPAMPEPSPMDASPAQVGHNENPSLNPELEQDHQLNNSFPHAENPYTQEQKGWRGWRNWFNNHKKRK